VKFAATDGVELAGLLYEPERRTNHVAIFLHGTGGASIFDSSRANLLAREFVTRGIAYFPFNNRGAHVIRKPGRGSAYERIRDCVPDIDGALRELRRRGYRELYLIGHSTGANKVAVYDHLKPRNGVRRYVLLAGGDDTGLMYEQLGPRRFRTMLARAREHRSDELVPGMLVSWRALYDMINPNGDYNVFPFGEVIRGERLSRRPLFRHVKKMRKPTLVVYGDQDPFCYGDVSRCVAILADHVGPNFELTIMEDADHGFGGREQELGTMIAEWLLA
jgi:pimeloyl-ACP methyl ester carboxylesterase